MSGVWAASVPLVRRNLVLTARNPAAVVAAVVTPMIFIFGFFAVLSRTMEVQGIDYAQYLPPAIVVQAMLFTALASGFALAEDVQRGVVRRFRSLPIPGGTVLAARALADASRALLSLTVVVVVGHLLGFRFEAGVAGAIGFLVLSVAFAVTVAFGCGAVGLRTGDPEVAGAALTMPYLVLLMLSSAFVPVSGFPDWIEPIVRWSPVTAVIDSLRALASGGDLAEPLARAAGWIVVLGVGFLAAGTRALRRSA